MPDELSTQTPQIPQRYLGDGLYADFDGFQFRLYTERENGIHEVYLDGPTLAAFLAFHKEVTTR